MWPRSIVFDQGDAPRGVALDTPSASARCQALLVFIWKRWWLGLMLCGYGFAGYVWFSFVCTFR